MYACQAFLLRSFLPIRPGKCADDAAGCADHTRTEGGHWDCIAECVHIHHRFMAAQLAGHGERANALRPHVGERHRRTAVAILGHAGILTQWPFERLENRRTVGAAEEIDQRLGDLERSRASVVGDTDMACRGSLRYDL
jgi:hypothetical protein